MSNTGWSTPANPQADSVNWATAPLAMLYAIKAAELTPENVVIVRDRLLMDWEETKKKAALYKEAELKARNVFVAFAFDPTKTKGTENLELGNGYKAKTVKKETVSFIKDAEGKIDINAIERALAKIEKVEGGKVIAERLVKWEPNFSNSEYKLLPPALKKIADEIIEIKSGTPTLEIIAPKSV